MLKTLLDLIWKQFSFYLYMHACYMQIKKNPKKIPYSLSEFTNPKSKLNNICQISILFDLLNKITHLQCS